MQTKTFITLFFLSTVFSATTWSMQPAAKLAATAARQRLALSVLRRSCMTSLRRPGMYQLPNIKTTRRFSSNSDRGSQQSTSCGIICDFIKVYFIGNVALLGAAELADSCGLDERFQKKRLQKMFGSKQERNA